MHPCYASSVPGPAIEPTSRRKTSIWRSLTAKTSSLVIFISSLWSTLLHEGRIGTQSHFPCVFLSRGFSVSVPPSQRASSCRLAKCIRERINVSCRNQQVPPGLHVRLERPDVRRDDGDTSRLRCKHHATLVDLPIRQNHAISGSQKLRDVV